ncbi:Uncharacterized protein APZ42_005309 [Daphnia magna]|uniref:Uncharacterized protein n=1 Tax=Daphnia magna TaxID=35525 RepID=A0A164GIQ5_9CRUS|nr:Uncharacterized protein APZ42_005309 [Daphnia magna]
MGLGAVGGGQVGDDDAGAVALGLGDAEVEEEARAGLGDHRDHRVVAQVVGAIDVGDPHGQMGGVAELVFGEVQGQAGHRGANLVRR